MTEQDNVIIQVQVQVYCGAESFHKMASTKVECVGLENMGGLFPTSEQAQHAHTLICMAKVSFLTVEDGHSPRQNRLRSPVHRTLGKRVSPRQTTTCRHTVGGEGRSSR